MSYANMRCTYAVGATGRLRRRSNSGSYRVGAAPTAFNYLSARSDESVHSVRGKNAGSSSSAWATCTVCAHGGLIRFRVPATSGIRKVERGGNLEEPLHPYCICDEGHCTPIAFAMGRELGRAPSAPSAIAPLLHYQ